MAHPQVEISSIYPIFKRRKDVSNCKPRVITLILQYRKKFGLKVLIDATSPLKKSIFKNKMCKQLTQSNTENFFLGFLQQRFSFSQIFKKLAC